MGWFDAKSWKLRRKIRDLQSDLKEAEAQGKYVVEDGLFFAELEDMGEMTMMVFGTTDILAAQEETVIRGFFDRNGFAVEKAKINREHNGLDDVEIIPPEEFTRQVGRALKNGGYRMVDDSEREMFPDLGKKIFPLSALIRSISSLFAAHAQKVISTTSIKNNKEGNRLLHWLPRIVEALAKKVDSQAVEIVQPHFEDAYDQFYRMIMHGNAAAQDSPSKREYHTPAPEPPKPTQERPGASTARLMAEQAPAPARQEPPARPAPQAVGGELGLKFAEALARIYKSLIRANPSRCVRNSQTVLEELNSLFEATATCVMVKVPQGHGLSIHAQAGKKLIWGEGRGGEGFAISSSILSACVKAREVIAQTKPAEPRAGGGGLDSSMVAYGIDATAAGPVVVNNDICAIVYLDRRGGKQAFSDAEKQLLARATQVFEQYPDLLLGLT